MVYIVDRKKVSRDISIFSYDHETMRKEGASMRWKRWFYNSKGDILTLTAGWRLANCTSRYFIASGLSKYVIAFDTLYLVPLSDYNVDYRVC